MNSSTFSAKSPSWFKTKVFSFVSLILLSFLLVGCGDDGESEGSKSSNKELTGFTFGSDDVKSANINQSEQTVDIAIAYNSTLDGYSSVPPTVTITGVSYSPNGTIDFTTATPKTYTVAAEDGTTKDYNITIRRAFVVSTTSELANAIDNITSDIANNKPVSYITIFIANDINLTGENKRNIPATWKDRNIVLENNSGTNIVTIGGLMLADNDTVELVGVQRIKSHDKELTGFTFGSDVVKSANINQSEQTVDITINYTSVNPTPTVIHTGASYYPMGAINIDSIPANYRITAEDGSSKKYSVIVRRAFIASNENQLKNAIDTINNGITNNVFSTQYITILVTNDITLTSEKTIPSSWEGRNIILENNSTASLVTITGLTIAKDSAVALSGVKVVKYIKSSTKELTGFTFSSGVIKPATINGTTVDITINYTSVNPTPTVIHTGVSYSPAGAINFANLPVNYRIAAEDDTTKDYNITIRRAIIVSDATELKSAIDTVTNAIANKEPTTYITIFVANDIKLTSKKTILSMWAGRNIILEKYNSNGQDVTITGLTVEGSGTVGLKGVKLVAASGSSAQIGADCSGANCGVSTRSYTGSGVGIWRYTNNATSSTNLDISLSNVAGKEVTVVFTNERSSSTTFPPNAISGKFLANEVSPQTVEPDIDNFNDMHDDIRNFDPSEIIRQIENNPQNFAIKPLEQKEWALNAKENWYVRSDLGGTRAATLKKQTSSNGRTINFWVQDGEFGSGKVTETMIADISSRFTNDIYQNVIGVAGEPWGTAGSVAYIAANQPINIVFIDFGGSNNIGYFWSLNNLISGCSSGSCSNAALVYFVDTQMIYSRTDGINLTLSTLTHELTHMINFYQRWVKISSANAFDTFLEEMSATMMEDIVASKISSSYHFVKNSRYRYWLSAPLYYCDFTDWGNCGDSYATAGSFGAYLLRQYGIGFYKSLLQGRVALSGDKHKDTIALLDSIIKTQTSNTEGLGRAVQRWGAGIALFPAASSPAGFGYPSRTELGFTLSAFDGDSFKSIRTLPTSQPSTLNGYGHYPLKRNITTYQYEETVIVPLGVSVTVIVK